MTKSELQELTESYISVYREVLLIDPLIQLNVRVVDDGKYFRSIKDSDAKLSWTIEINSVTNLSDEDVRLSVIQFLSAILCSDFASFNDEALALAIEKLECRLFNVFQNLLPNLGDASEG